MKPKIVDCTLRDGGLVNNFYFSDSFVQQLYETNKQVGINYMEFGYKASKKIFNTSKFGKWKFCTEEDLRNIISNNNSTMKTSVMADVGRCDYKNDFQAKNNSVIDMIRIATYIDTIQEAMRMVEHFHKLGYETTINLMAVSTISINELDNALAIIEHFPVDVIYLVDSYGSLYPKDIHNYVELYSKHCNSQTKLGIHAHNNQQLAFANTLKAYQLGVEYLDVTINSLGRGAGNCPSELLLSTLKAEKKTNIEPILQFIENNILKLKQEGLHWGYDIPYLLTGNNNKHPSHAIKFINDGNTDYYRFSQFLQSSSL